MCLICSRGNCWPFYLRSLAKSSSSGKKGMGAKGEWGGGRCLFWRLGGAWAKGRGKGGVLSRAVTHGERECGGAGARSEWLRAALSEVAARARGRGGLANKGGRRGAGDVADRRGRGTSRPAGNGGVWERVGERGREMTGRR
jgi:hypothetical protein